MTLPGACGGGDFAGNPAPRPAADAAKIGLTGFPAPRTPQNTPHPAPPWALLFSLLALAELAVQLTCRDNFATIFFHLLDISLFFHD